MKTSVIEINCVEVDIEELEECAAILRQGGTVVFPTETVYGLGANGLDPTAIRKIFHAKGRPSDNPLILHIASIDDLKPLVKEIPPQAHRVMEAFWPGPLTLIFEKSEIVPEEITAGLNTVAIRLPQHPIAKKLIELAGVPVAAPSANLSGKPSPTNPQHVIKDLMGKVDAIIAGGSCDVGLESTVLDMTIDIPMILRPGGITKEMLETVLPEVATDPGLSERDHNDLVPKSPGMKYTHYAPEASVILVRGDRGKTIEKITSLQQQYQSEGLKVGIICTDETINHYQDGLIKSIGSRKDLNRIAANLFNILREFDETDVDMILAETVEEIGVGIAVMNRLLKAAGYQLVEV